MSKVYNIPINREGSREESFFMSILSSDLSLLYNLKLSAYEKKTEHFGLTLLLSISLVTLSSHIESVSNTNLIYV